MIYWKFEKDASLGFVVLFFSFLFTSNGFSQVVKGSVVDSKGGTIPSASIFIKETNMGTTTNQDGLFEFQLPADKTYHLFFQSLGFEKKELTIMPHKSEPIVLKVVLNEYQYQLKEVRVMSGGEDPAYPIMRKAIANAPKFLNQAESYEAEVYIKGSLFFEKLPKLIAKKMAVNGQKMEAGKIFTSESVNLINFTQPNIYSHKVLSSRSSFPSDEKDNVMGYINASFYSPKLDEIISPLAPNAFSQYKYRYEGYFFDGNLAVNKISVIPRRKSQQLVSGTLYILDNLWSIHSLDFTNEAFWGTVHFKQIYSPVKSGAWFPTTHVIDVKASIMGVKANFAYNGSVKYNKLVLSDQWMKSIPKEVVVAAENVVENTKSSLTKKETKLKALFKKDEFSNREAMKVARMLQKESHQSRDTSLEVINNYQFIHVKDSIVRDTTYWNSIRPIPLTNNEIKGFEIKDSLRLVAKQNLATDSLKKSKVVSKIIEGTFSGHEFLSKDSTWRFKYNGLISPKNIGFNPIQGFWVKQSANLSYQVDSIRKWVVAPWIQYGFSSKNITGGGEVFFSYSGTKRGQLRCILGSQIDDFNNQNGTSVFGNTIYNLFLKENYKKYYQRNFIELSNRIDLRNGLVSYVALDFEKNERVENSTNYSFFHTADKYPANNPVCTIDESFFNSINESSITVNLAYTPYLHYKMYKGKKQMLKSSYPTLSAQFKQAFGGVWDESSKYTRLSLMVNQEIELSFFNKISYSVSSGNTFNGKNLNFSSFKHFNTQEPLLDFRSTDNSFRLLSNYQYSTPTWWVDGYFSYQTPYLMIKYLPWFSERLWTENLYFNYLSAPSIKNYSEVGYGISNLFLMGEAGIYAGFEGSNFKSWGVRLALHF